MTTDVLEYTSVSGGGQRTLAALLQDANTECWSSRRIALEAEKRGITVSYTAVDKYLRTPPVTPSETVLKAFSAVFEVPMTALRKAAAVSPGETEPFILPERANRHTQPQREAVLHMIRVLLAISDLD
ncbi:hypothetical protein ACWF5H_12750 [Arthrobacter sp. NPDC055138]